MTEQKTDGAVEITVFEDARLPILSSPTSIGDTASTAVKVLEQTIDKSNETIYELTTILEMCLIIIEVKCGADDPALSEIIATTRAAVAKAKETA
tara:strand:- start:53 stop:337 length:285 start_codon:yes stop_codon:yes gene_type:complete